MEKEREKVVAAIRNNEAKLTPFVISFIYLNTSRRLPERKGAGLESRDGVKPQEFEPLTFR